MSIFKNFFSGFKSNTQAFDIFEDDFTKIDVEGIKKELNLAKRAANNGSNGIPAIDSTQKDATATAIDAHLVGLVKEAKGAYHNQMQSKDTLDTEQAEKDERQEMTNLFYNTGDQLDNMAHDYYNLLFSKKENFLDGQLRVRHFKQKHGIIGPADYPTKREKFNISLTLIIFMCGEAIVSAFSLGNDYAGGPAGILLIIGLFCGVSVLLSFLVGLGGRYVHYRFIGTKIFYLTLVFLAFVAITLFVFGIAHYRDVIVVTPPELHYDTGGLIPIVIEKMRANLILLEGEKSYMLLGAGWLCVFFSIQKGYYYTDPYPGYGWEAEKQEKRKIKYIDLQNDALEEMTQLVGGKSEEIRGIVANLKASERSIKNRKNNKKRLYEKYMDWTKTVQVAGENLYTFYREENLNHRTSDRVPKSFEIYHYESVDTEVEKPVTDESESELLHIHTLIEELEKLRAKFINDLKGKYEKYRKTYHNLEKVDDKAKLRQEKYRNPSAFGKQKDD